MGLPPIWPHKGAFGSKKEDATRMAQLHPPSFGHRLGLRSDNSPAKVLPALPNLIRVAIPS